MSGNSDRIILALDLPHVAEARALYRELKGAISFFKIGLELFYQNPRDLVKEIKDGGARVFLDFKFSDIERTVEAAVRNVLDSGADVITVHANPPTLRGAHLGRAGGNLKIWAVTVLSGMGPEELAMTGDARSAEEMVASATRMAIACGADGVIVSGAGIPVARREIERGGRKLTMTVPGVRPVGADLGDQKRVVTPKAALEAGADYLVIGRPIRTAKNRTEAVRAIVAEMDRAER
jgi:orotidine-5'-phosphate decarboxylase